MDKKIVTPDDMGTGLIYDDTAKQFKAVSQVVFTNKEATVNLLFNDIHLVFRQLANSNRPMLCTGVKYQGIWYGDSPDDAPATDPFANVPLEPLQAIDDIYAKKGKDEYFNSISAGNYKFKTKKITVQAPHFRKFTTVETGIAWDKYISVSAKVKTSDTDYELFNTIKYTTNKENTHLTIQNTATTRFNNKEMTLYITYED